jgi:hypothetical protein
MNDKIKMNVNVRSSDRSITVKGVMNLREHSRTLLKLQKKKM